MTRPGKFLTIELALAVPALGAWLASGDVPALIVLAIALHVAQLLFALLY